MSKEVALITKDLTDAGISSQLTSNDLLEVVAHDIYDRYIDSINDIIKRSKALHTKYSKLFNPELAKMKRAIQKHLSVQEPLQIIDDENLEGEYYEDEVDLNGVLASFGKNEGSWNQNLIWTLQINEKDRGSFVEKKHFYYQVPSLKTASAKIKLVITEPQKDNEQEIKQGSITGIIHTTVKKTFTQVITVPVSRFKKFNEEVVALNKEVDAVMDFLPKNGGLSVERFTRESRVKMNKKILSAQSPEFRKKMSELFKISL